jgi:hypothetical protein
MDGVLDRKPVPGPAPGIAKVPIGGHAYHPVVIDGHEHWVPVVVFLQEPPQTIVLRAGDFRPLIGGGPNQGIENGGHGRDIRLGGIPGQWHGFRHGWSIAFRPVRQEAKSCQSSNGD